MTKSGPKRNRETIEEGGLKKSRAGNFSMWSYRCYYIKPNHGTWKCLNVLRGITLDFYDSFVWNEFEDRINLKKYIDALVSGQKIEIDRFEKTGVITEIVPNAKHDVDSVDISLERLLEVLSMRDKLRVPLYGRVGLCTSRSHNNTFIPRDAYLVMAKYGAIMPGVPDDWSPENAVAVNAKQIDRLGLDETKMHSGAHLDNVVKAPAEVQAGEVPDKGVVKQPKEVERLRRQVTPDVIELFTEVHPDDGEKFYARRLISADGELLYSATSFKDIGPWKEWSRNSSALLARGIDV